ncbi:uncharacterized protein LOC110847837 isoform X3 [Folsomia candida]|uniref:uncharacterized protein LOC110847837 isoform X3 n=1 Tax=Folsomia candida TaxID=158441 RepID=UPI000B90221F|nr:uncharacterized protein LOC110847837 isoform X3 [Folsomia candida]
MELQINSGSDQCHNSDTKICNGRISSGSSSGNYDKVEEEETCSSRSKKGKGRIMYDKSFLMKCSKSAVSRQKPADFPLPDLGCTLGALKSSKPATPVPPSVPRRKDEIGAGGGNGGRRGLDPSDNISLRPHSGSFVGGCSPVSTSQSKYYDHRTVRDNNRGDRDRDNRGDRDPPQPGYRDRMNYRDDRDTGDRDRRGGDRDRDRDRDRPNNRAGESGRPERVVYNSRWGEKPESGWDSSSSNSVYHDTQGGGGGSNKWNNYAPKNGRGDGISSGPGGHYEKKEHHHGGHRDYNNRRGGRDNPRNDEQDEPEWFSGGPTSRHETMELRGFMDDERKDMANAGGDKKNNHKEITKGATETEKPSETAQPPQDFSTSHGFSTAQQKEEQPAVDSAFSLEKILQMEKIPGIHNESEEGISRFSKFFQKNSENEQKTAEPIPPPNKMEAGSSYIPSEKILFVNLLRSSSLATNTSVVHTPEESGPAEDKKEIVAEMGNALRNMLQITSKKNAPADTSAPPAPSDPSAPPAPSDPPGPSAPPARPPGPSAPPARPPRASELPPQPRPPVGPRNHGPIGEPKKTEPTTEPLPQYLGDPDNPYFAEWQERHRNIHKPDLKALLAGQPKEKETGDLRALLLKLIRNPADKITNSHHKGVPPNPAGAVGRPPSRSPGSAGPLFERPSSRLAQQPDSSLDSPSTSGLEPISSETELDESQDSMYRSDMQYTLLPDASIQPQMENIERRSPGGMHVMHENGTFSGIMPIDNTNMMMGPPIPMQQQQYIQQQQPQPGFNVFETLIRSHVTPNQVPLTTLMVTPVETCTAQQILGLLPIEIGRLVQQVNPDEHFWNLSEHQELLNAVSTGKYTFRTLLQDLINGTSYPPPTFAALLQIILSGRLKIPTYRPPEPAFILQKFNPVPVQPQQFQMQQQQHPMQRMHHHQQHPQQQYRHGGQHHYDHDQMRRNAGTPVSNMAAFTPTSVMRKMTASPKPSHQQNRRTPPVSHPELNTANFSMIVQQLTGQQHMQQQQQPQPHHMPVRQHRITTPLPIHPAQYQAMRQGQMMMPQPPRPQQMMMHHHQNFAPVRNVNHHNSRHDMPPH